MSEDNRDDVLKAMRLSSETNTRPLTPAARRALAEAEARRRAHDVFKVDPASLPPEIDGRRPDQGLEPVRYGDWEKKGIVSDF